MEKLEKPTELFINVVPIRKKLEKFINKDREDGVKHVFYFWHQEDKQIHALDTKEQFNELLQLYESQGFKLYKTLTPFINYEVKGITLYVFRHQDKTLNFGEMLSHAFGYVPAGCEVVIAEITM